MSRGALFWPNYCWVGKRFLDGGIGRDSLPFCKVTIRRVRCAQGPYFTETKSYPASPKTIGEMIRKRRLDLGLLQREAAKRIGCDQMTMVNWERGHTTPQVAHMAQIVAFLGFNPIQVGTSMAERFVNFRKSRGITQNAFAAQIGVDQSTLAKWERGERQPIGKYLDRVRLIIPDVSGGRVQPIGLHPKLRCAGAESAGKRKRPTSVSTA